MGEILTSFDIDDEKMAVLSQCIDHYGVGDAGAEWPNNILSTRTVAYRNGVIAKRDEAVTFATDADELALCERLAREAKAVAGESEIGFGSEGANPFHPFFIAANTDERPDRITPELIKARLNGTILPPAEVKVEPLREDAEWFQNFLADIEDMGIEDEAERDEYLLPWPPLFAWFGAQDFVDTALVSIGDYSLNDLDDDEMPEGTEMAPSVFPRLALGLTRGGSLCGLFGWTVQT